VLVRPRGKRKTMIKRVRSGVRGQGRELLPQLPERVAEALFSQRPDSSGVEKRKICA